MSQTALREILIDAKRVGLRLEIRLMKASERKSKSAAKGIRAVKRILMPVDFSAPSKTALKYAEQFAKQLGAGLILVHVVERVWYPHDWEYTPVLEGNIGPVALEKEARVRLTALASEVKATVPVTPHVRSGTPWNEIVLAAKEYKADLIIIGTHGRTGLKHIVMGSTAERVVRHAHCPVLVVR